MNNYEMPLLEVLTVPLSILSSAPLWHVQVAMQYTGKLQSNGKIFDSTVGKKAFEFRLGK